MPLWIVPKYLINSTRSIQVNHPCQLYTTEKYVSGLFFTLCMLYLIRGIINISWSYCSDAWPKPHGSHVPELVPCSTDTSTWLHAPLSTKSSPLEPIHTMQSHEGQAWHYNMFEPIHQCLCIDLACTLTIPCQAIMPTSNHIIPAHRTSHAEQVEPPCHLCLKRFKVSHSTCLKHTSTQGTPMCPNAL